MGFKTKLDYSNNRQIKQHPETLTALSGGTSFGLTFADLTKGPDLATSGETENYSFVATTFSGNATTTIYNWYDPRMSIGEPYLSAITPSNSGDTQIVNPVFAPSASIIIDGNVVNTAFTGVTFDLTGIIMFDLGGGNYIGTVESEFFDVLSAATAEYTGRTIWVDSSGITRTERLIVTNNPTVGYVLTCDDAEGMASWAPSTGGGGGTGDTYVTGGTYNAGTAIFTNNTGGTFNVTGWLWSAGTGTNAIATVNGNNIASGDYSHAEGRLTQAIGDYSHVEGFGGYASGDYSHVEGNGSNAHGQASHAEGSSTIATGDYSHAGGNNSQSNGIASFVHGQNSHANGNTTIVLGANITGSTDNTTYVDFLNIKSIPSGTSVNNLGFDANGNVIVGTTGGTNFWSASTGTNAIGVISFGGTASGDYGISIGWQTTASGPMSLAQNSGTTASGYASYAEGAFTIASGQASHAEGAYTIAGGNYATHAEGIRTFAYGEGSHAEGRNTIASGTSSHAQNDQTTANGSYSHTGGIFTTANGTGSFVHGSGSTANADWINILGNGISGTTSNTTYVNSLNIGTVGSGPGTIDLGVNAGGFVVNQASDERLKENINTIENALDVVMNLRGVTYNWKDRLNGGNDLRIGFIAQEVQEVIPELVTQNGEYLGVQYKDVPALLVEAIKELVNGNSEYGNTFLETQTIQAEDNNIELNFNGTLGSSVNGGIKILRGNKEPTSLLIDTNGNWISNVNILSKGFVIPEYTPTSSQDSSGVVGNIVQDDNYIYIKRNSGWKRTPKLEDF